MIEVFARGFVMGAGAGVGYWACSIAYQMYLAYQFGRKWGDLPARGRSHRERPVA